MCKQGKWNAAKQRQARTMEAAFLAAPPRKAAKWTRSIVAAAFARAKKGEACRALSKKGKD
jgi:hypothetical protein